MNIRTLGQANEVAGELLKADGDTSKGVRQKQYTRTRKLASDELRIVRKAYQSLSCATNSSLKHNSPVYSTLPQLSRSLAVSHQS